MTCDRNQSQIAEVRDQLSLDYADGQYLNVVGHNLGINRSVFGFGDDEWRAVVKEIALQFKQVRNRFRAVLAILFGPQITEVGTLAQAVAIGDKTILVNDSSKFPQIGTIILDEGQATEESLEYCFIDRTNHEIYLANDVTASFVHQLTESDDAESPVIAADPTLTILSVTNTRDFPTTGFPYTVVLGRGTDNEEVAILTAVDQEAGTVTLSAAITNPHEGLRTTILRSRLALPYISFATYLTLESSRQFPESGVVLVDVKTDEFTAVAGTVNNVTAVTGTWSANVHAGMFVRFADDTTTVALQGVEVGIASNTGDTIVFTAPLGTAPVAGDRFTIMQPPFNATAGTVNNVTVNPGTFTIDFQVGNKIIFDGNVTAALKGVEADIIANTDSVLTFAAALGSAPAAGDTFRIAPRIEYSVNDGTNNVLTLPFPVRDLTMPDEAIVEVLRANSTVALAPVKVVGAGWDLYEVTPRELEIYLPIDLQDPGDLRSASYLHGSEISPTPSTTLSLAATAGDASIELTDFSDFPIVGVVAIDPGGANERVGYYKNGDQATGTITHTGATILDAETFVLNDGINPAVTFEFDNNDSVVQSFTLRKVDITGLTTDNERRDAMITAINGAPLLNISAAAVPLTVGQIALTNTVGGNAGNQTITKTVVDAGFIVAGMSGGVDRLTIATQTLAGSHLIGATVDLYQPVHTSPLLIGDEASTADTFPGPYVYEIGTAAPTGTVALTTLVDLLPGPTRVTIGSVPFNTALEVENATPFDLVNLPYTIIVGRDTGNRETVTVTDVNLKQRAATTVSAAIVTPGVTNVIEVASLGPGGTDAADFPNATGYRVLIDRGGANEEVCYVLSAVSGAPNFLLLEDNTAKAHAIGETVELLSDVLTVNTLTDTHIGKIPYTQRSTALTGTSPHRARFPSYGSAEISNAETVEPNISSLDVASAAGLDVTGGRVILNPANGQVDAEEALTVDLAAGGTVVTVADSTGFPTTYPFVVTLSRGTPREEKALCTNNNTGLGQLTLGSGTYGAQFAHTVANRSTIDWQPGPLEVIEYDAISGTTLSFSPAIVLQSTHSPGEVVCDSSVDSDPRRDGFDFPLRMPVDIRERIEFLWDLIRAAGVRVTIIDTR